MTKTLHALSLAFDGNSTSLLFEDYATLLATRGALGGANIPGLLVSEEASNRHAFDKPASALSFARLWVSSLGGKAPAEDRPAEEAPALPDHIAADKTHKGRVMAMLLRPGGVAADEIVAEFGIKRDSATALISTACAKHGYTSHLEEGRYTAQRGRETHVAFAKRGRAKASSSVTRH